MPTVSIHAPLGKLIDAGIIPPNCTRMIIDFPVGGLVRVYYSTLVDQEDLSVVFDELIAAAKAPPARWGE